MIDSKTKLKDVCNSVTAVDEFLHYKAKHHYNYKFYTHLNVVKSILENNAFILSCGNDWNDCADKKRFNKVEDQYFNYALCFSFSKSENIAMWMLYGGLNKDGAMINCSSNLIKRLLNTECIEVGSLDQNGFVCEKTIKLTEENEYCSDLIDILYVYQQDNDYLTIKRSDEREKDCDINCLDSLMYKSFAWNYENECRFVIKVKKQYLLGVKKYTHIRIKINNLANLLKNRIVLSPNFDEVNNCGWEFGEKSKLGNEINWDLCRKCGLKKEGIK